MKGILLYSLLLIISLTKVSAQDIKFTSFSNKIIDLGEVENNNEGFEGFEALDLLLQDVNIVMLGEQSHGEIEVREPA